MRLTVVIEYERREGMNRSHEALAEVLADMLGGEEIELWGETTDSVFVVTDVYPAESTTRRR